jgi:tRNA (guanine37-N1)-methyltransferase
VKLKLKEIGCQILRQVLPAGMTIPSAFESVGHIAHLNLRNEHLPFRHVIAQVSTLNLNASEIYNIAVLLFLDYLCLQIPCGCTFSFLIHFVNFVQIVLEKNKPRIRTVVNKTDVIHNKYRTMQLELLAGNSSLITTVVEHGLSLRVDLAAV